MATVSLKKSETSIFLISVDPKLLKNLQVCYSPIKSGKKHTMNGPDYHPYNRGNIRQHITGN